jgi:hypothetical protein
MLLIVDTLWIPFKLAAVQSPVKQSEAHGASTPSASAACVRVGTRPRHWAEHYSGTVGTGASGWKARAERSMAMAAYVITPVTTQRISVR